MNDRVKHMNTTHTLRGALAIASACFVIAFCLAVTVPFQASADTLSTAAVTAKSNSSKITIASSTAKELKAYKRAVAACVDYANQPNPIVIDVSDLKLTAKQALNVGYMLHANGELFWINTYNDDSYGTKKFSLPCYYDDAKVDKMRKRLNAAVKKGLKRISPGMDSATKVHMLHDYLIDTMKYKATKKDAYAGLVQGKGDCFGFTLSMDLLLRRAGFDTDVAFNEKLDHAWNLVRIGKSWFHVDVTWDNGYTGRWFSPYFNWKKNRCHLYLLQSDYVMLNTTVDPDTNLWLSSHVGKRTDKGKKNTKGEGWSCHHKCSNSRYASARGLGEYFNQHCNDYRVYARSFTVDGLKYVVTGVGKAKLSKVAGKAQRTTSKLGIPGTVTYKGITYRVVGISKKAFSTASAKVLSIASTSLNSSRVKGSLIDSKVTKIKLLGDAKKKKAAYKKCFKKSNSGKGVTVS